MSKENKKITTLIAEPGGYSQKAVAIYKSLGPTYFWFDMPGTRREKILKKADNLVVRLAVGVDRNLIDRMPNLKIIATSTTGLNHIDVDYAEKKNIKIISLRGHSGFLKDIPSTAEHTIALLLSLARNIPWAFDDVKQGRWNSKAWSGRQLAGKTFGILGFGRLGKIVCRYARAFEMKVIASDPYVSEKIIKSCGAAKADMNTLFKKSDIISLHVLLTDDTYNLVKEKHLKSMKPSAYLLNTARAELIGKGELLKALKNKWIAGAGIDVMWDEQGDGGHLKTDPLLQYAKRNKNLIVVPHIGGATFEAMETTQEFIADLVLKYIKNG